MNALQNRLASCLIAVLVVAGILSSLAAQETEAQSVSLMDALPSGTLFYANANHLQKHWGTLKKQLYSELSDSERETFKKRKKKLLENIATSFEKESGIDPMSVIPHIQRIQIALSSVDAQISSDTSLQKSSLEDASFYMAVTMDRADVFSQLFTGKLADRMEKDETINSYTIYEVKPKENETASKQTMYLLQRGKTLFGSTDRTRLVGLAEGPDSKHLPDTTLSDSEAYQSSRSKGNSKDAVFAYANIDGVWSTLRSSLEKQAKDIYKKLASSLGFEEMKSAFLSAQLGKNLVTLSGGVNMTGNDFPLYDILMNTETGSLELLNSIPSDAFLGSVSKIPDFQKQFPKIKSKVIELLQKFGKTEKEAKKQWMMVTMMTKSQINVGVKELLSQFGTEGAFYMTSPGEATNGTVKAGDYAKQIVIDLSLKDADRMKTMFEEQIRSAKGFQNVKQMEQKVTHNGTTLYSYPLPLPMQPTLFFHNGHMTFTGSLEEAKALIDGKAEDSSVTTTDWFSTPRGRLPENLSSIQFTNNAGYARFMSKVQEAQNKNAGKGGTESEKLGRELGRMLVKGLFQSTDENTGSVTGTVASDTQLQINSVNQLNFSAIDAKKMNEYLNKLNKKIEKELEEKENEDKEAAK